MLQLSFNVRQTRVAGHLGKPVHHDRSALDGVVDGVHQFEQTLSTDHCRHHIIKHHIRPVGEVQNSHDDAVEQRERVDDDVLVRPPGHRQHASDHFIVNLCGINRIGRSRQQVEPAGMLHGQPPQQRRVETVGLPDSVEERCLRTQIEHRRAQSHL